MKSGGRTHGEIIGYYKVNVLRKKYLESTKLELIKNVWFIYHIYTANLDLSHVNALRNRATPIHLLIIFDHFHAAAVVK